MEDEKETSLRKKKGSGDKLSAFDLSKIARRLVRYRMLAVSGAKPAPQAIGLDSEEEEDGRREEDLEDTSTRKMMPFFFSEHSSTSREQQANPRSELKEREEKARKDQEIASYNISFRPEDPVDAFG